MAQAAEARNEKPQTNPPADPVEISRDIPAPVRCFGGHIISVILGVSGIRQLVNWVTGEYVRERGRVLDAAYAQRHTEELARLGITEELYSRWMTAVINIKHELRVKHSGCWISHEYTHDLAMIRVFPPSIYSGVPR